MERNTFFYTPTWKMFFLVLLFAISGAAFATVPSIEKWDVFNIKLNGPSVGNPFTDVVFSAIFKHDNEEVKVIGFYDGDGKYIIHFSPDTEGKWTYKTSSNVPELSERTGMFNCVSPSKSNHGPVKIEKTYYFKYADGTPYFEVGTTCYQWVCQPKELQDLTIKTLSTAPFNKIRMCIFPKWYIYNRTEPSIAAYLNKTDSTYDFNRFNPAFWQNLEKRIVELGNLGIQADIVLFHPYDKWGFATMTKEQDDKYIRYAISRIAAYKNVWWAVANEYDFMTVPPRAGHAGNKNEEDWDRYFSILQNEDPYHRFRSIHNGHNWYDHTKNWVTHASIQSSALEKGIELRNKYQKPVIFDECKYEGNIEKGWGQLTAEQMVERFWWGAMNGCYVGHGECIKASDDILWWGKGGNLHGDSPIRIAYFRKIMEALPFDEMTPVQLDKNVYELSKEGKVYLVYVLKKANSIKITLTGNYNYTVEYINTWNMKSEVIKTVTPGEFTFDAPVNNYLIKITATSELNK
jgi:hypothetical protein